ncbi:hypothetical protein NPIL_530191 [Nephila pilipes]|uniref:Uncharacterized protein n=1 Tax=Nephila pilipes TaxID=299642 RepID=A0A8X6MQV8_NEPPI|nr:hypothetical protein NPIL_530191 [Nephila pilipes]
MVCVRIIAFLQLSNKGILSEDEHFLKIGENQLDVGRKNSGGDLRNGLVGVPIQGLSIEFFQHYLPSTGIPCLGELPLLFGCPGQREEDAASSSINTGARGELPKTTILNGFHIKGENA